VQGEAAAAATAPTSGPVPAGGFTLSANDKTVQGAVRRWASALNYQLVWDAPSRLDAPIVGEYVIAGATIEEALNRLLNGMASKGYALDATIYKNRVIRLSAAAAAAEPAGLTAGPQVKPAPTPAPAAPTHSRPVAPEPHTDSRSNPVAEASRWRMLQTDENVERMLTRWAQQAQSSVLWTASARVPIRGDAVVNGADFKSAAEQVISSAAALGYPLKLVQRGDGTLVVSGY
jgi:hypothetical protein